MRVSFGGHVFGRLRHANGDMNAFFFVKLIPGGITRCLLVVDPLAGTVAAAAAALGNHFPRRTFGIMISVLV